MSFGPGPLSPALMALIGANVVVFLIQAFMPFALERALGLQPAAVLGSADLWRLASYMFLHADVSHILFNMLALWMFGTELERMWGTPYFLKFYFVTGVGAAVLTVIFALLPFPFADHVYRSNVIGASGAIFGLLLAYAMYFPDRQLLLFLLFPVRVRYAVMIFGAVELFVAISGRSGVANATHLGGLLVGYLYLKGRRGPLDEIRYRYAKWQAGRARPKFDVYQGGRSGAGTSGADWTKEWKKHVH